MTVDYEKYTAFVDEVTSSESKHFDAFDGRVFDLTEHLPVERLLTAALGLCAEGGEFTEVVKKISFKVNQLMMKIFFI